MPKSGGWSKLMIELLESIIMVAVIILIMVSLYTGFIADIIANLTAVGGLAAVAATLLGVIYWVAVIFVTLILLITVAKHLK